jgi:hypothetical protein
MLVFLTSEGFFVDGPFGLLLLLRFDTTLSSTIILFVPGSISVPFSSSINGRFLSGSERAGRPFVEEEVDEGGSVGGGAEAAIIFARASGAILLLLV